MWNKLPNKNVIFEDNNIILRYEFYVCGKNVNGCSSYIIVVVKVKWLYQPYLS